jgi:hypothetical protein
MNNKHTYSDSTCRTNTKYIYSDSTYRTNNGSVDLIRVDALGVGSVD